MSRNDFENLQSVYIRTFNQIVRQSFRDDIPDNDISTPESQMRTACLIKDSDSAPIMELRLWLFYVVREEARRLHPPIIEAAMPDQEPIVNQPQVVLRFVEDAIEARRANRKIPKQVRVSFRITDQRVEQISQSDVDRLSTAVRTQFPRTFTFRTGRTKASYYDERRGYRLILSAHSQGVAERFIDRILAIQGHSPEWDFFSVSEAPRRNFRQEQRITILGQSQRLPERRIIADVRLRRATLKLGLQDIVLWETI